MTQNEINEYHGKTISLLEEVLNDMPDIEVLGAAHYLDWLDLIKERITVIDKTIKANQH